MKNILSVRGFIVGFVVALMAILPVSAYAGVSNQRTIILGPLAARMTISHEGDCENLLVQIGQELNRDTIVEYDVVNCRVTNVTGKVINTVRTGAVATAGNNCIDWIHSSQTVQDPLNIDVAKLRINGNRCYNGKSTWFREVNAAASTSKHTSWNYVDAGYPKITSVDRNPNTKDAHAYATAQYHTDFFACNIGSSSRQTIRLGNRIVSKPNGRYEGYWDQHIPCNDFTHMATRVYMDQTKNFR